MAVLGETIIGLSRTVCETRSASSHSMVSSEAAVYQLLQNDREALHHFNQASRLNRLLPSRFTPTRNNPHFARGGKRRTSKSPSKSVRKAAAKREKGEAKSPTKEASSSSSCGPDCGFPMFRDDEDPQDPPVY